MKLYITPGSPYARMARMVVIEKGLQDRVEVIQARTRVADSPYYGINPSGRVPYLLRDDGVGLEKSAVICAYLDRLDGEDNAAFGHPAGAEGWEALRLEALARSNVVDHEAARSRRMLELWEEEVRHPLMRGPLNMVQLTAPPRAQ